jgi:hypothetical protein
MPIMVKITGFYSNIKPGIPLPGLPALDSSTPKLDPHTVAVVSRYLNDGTPIVVSPGNIPDIFDRTKQVLFDVVTDGEWVWPKHAAYYCETYHVAPDAALVAKAVDRQGECQPLDQDRLMQVDRELDELVDAMRDTAGADDTFVALAQLATTAWQLYDEAVETSAPSLLAQRIGSLAQDLDDLRDQLPTHRLSRRG